MHRRERLAAAIIAAAALALFLNGSLLSPRGALPVDLSINLTAAHPPPPPPAPPPLPLTLLDWRDATHVYLVLNHLFLFAAVALTLATLRPRLPLRWLPAGAPVPPAAL